MRKIIMLNLVTADGYFAGVDGSTKKQFKLVEGKAFQSDNELLGYKNEA